MVLCDTENVGDKTYEGFQVLVLSKSIYCGYHLRFGGRSGLPSKNSPPKAEVHLKYIYI